MSTGDRKQGLERGKEAERAAEAEAEAAANEQADDFRMRVMARRWIQRKAVRDANPTGELPRAAGALPSDVRARMEPQLGADLSAVKLGTDGKSATAAEQLGARAFTVDGEVHFGAGEFAPGTKEGDRLLAHELTHVVQGQRSGIQRKEVKEGDAEGGEHHGHEVSEPGEPAEQEADAVADGVVEKLHGNKDKKKADKSDAKGATDDYGAQAKAAESTSAHDAPQQSAPAVAAKLSSSGGRKIHLTRPPGASPAKSSPTTTTATASSSTAGTTPKPNLKTPQDVKKLCAPDPIAMQKLADVDGETNVDPSVGGNAKAKQEFYQHVMDYVNANPAVPANTIFNSCFNSAASNWKFKGTKINPAAISRICSRTCGLSGWWWDVVKKAPFEAEARNVLGPSADKDSVNALAQGMWKERVKDGANLLSSVDKSAAIKPKGQTWFTPDKIQLRSAGDAGFAELMRINALQPEWFPEGTVSFELNPSAFHGDARKPTAYDGMQSALWVSRPDGDTYGVTGGSAKEFLAQNVQCSGITSARAIVPSTDLRGELQTAMKKAYDNALSMDPMLKQAIDGEKDPKKKEGLQGLVPNLTDQVIRGDLSFGSVPKAIRDIIGDTTKTTALERKQPTKNQHPSGTGKRP